MAKKAPKKRNLEYYKKAAKKLHRDARKRNSEAIRRIVETHPKISRNGAFDPESFKLTDAQHLIAVGEGEASWPALKRSIVNCRVTGSRKQRFWREARPVRKRGSVSIVRPVVFEKEIRIAA